jgi:hypothetical protein
VFVRRCGDDWEAGLKVLVRLRRRLAVVPSCDGNEGDSDVGSLKEGLKLMVRHPASKRDAGVESGAFDCARDPLRVRTGSASDDHEFDWDNAVGLCAESSDAVYGALETTAEECSDVDQTKTVERPRDERDGIGAQRDDVSITGQRQPLFERFGQRNDTVKGTTFVSEQKVSQGALDRASSHTRGSDVYD